MKRLIKNYNLRNIIILNNSRISKTTNRFYKLDSKIKVNLSYFSKKKDFNKIKYFFYITWHYPFFKLDIIIKKLSQLKKKPVYKDKKYWIDLSKKKISVNSKESISCEFVSQDKYRIINQASFDILSSTAECVVTNKILNVNHSLLTYFFNNKGIVVFANGRLGLEILKYLKKIRANVLCIVHNSKKKESCTKEIKKVFNLDEKFMFSFDKLNSEKIKLIEKLQASICFSIWSSFIFPKKIIKIFPFGIYNLHNSLLPQLAGSGANIWTIIEKKQAGVTLHKINENIDDGPIIAQLKIQYDFSDNGKSLFDKQIDGMIKIFLENYNNLLSNNFCYLKSKYKKSFKFLKYRDSLKKIDLDKKIKVEDLLNIVRAYDFGDLDSCEFLDRNGKSWKIKLIIKKNGNKRI